MAKVLEVHDWDCECDYCSLPLGEYVAKYGFDCSDCRHHHAGSDVAYRCFNCACGRVPSWLPSSSPARDTEQG